MNLVWGDAGAHPSPAAAPALALRFCRRLASDLGVLPISLEDYLKLLQWTARLLESGQRSTIPKDLEAVLDRLDVNHERWLDTVDSCERCFCHAVGPPASLARVAQRMEVSHLKGATVLT